MDPLISIYGGSRRGGQAVRPGFRRRCLGCALRDKLMFARLHCRIN